MLRGSPGSFSTTEHLLVFVLSVIIVPVIPLAKVIAGGGLLFPTRWAYRFMLMVVLVDFLIKFCGSINYCVSCCFYIGTKPSWIDHSAGADFSYSMWPIYIIALFDLLVIAVLLREEVQRYFTRTRT